jgi:signal transduction histidine kinase
MLADMVHPSDANGAEIARTARDSVTSLVEMVNQMLDVSRMEEGKMELAKTPADLAQIVHASLAPLRALAGARRIEIVAPERVAAEVDADIVRRVIGNLAGNAIKFTADRGLVRVVIARTAADEWMIEVIDDGPGIPEADHERIFEKFGQARGSRTTRTGSGLGLTFARMAVEAHGGRIGVRSTPGRGSTFWFTLPASMGTT